MSLITNLDHFLDTDVELPKPAKELLEFLTSIVSAVSNEIDEPIICTGVKCREPKCIGEMEAWYVEDGPA